MLVSNSQPVDSGRRTYCRRLSAMSWRVDPGPPTPKVNGQIIFNFNWLNTNDVHADSPLRLAGFDPEDGRSAWPMMNSSCRTSGELQAVSKHSRSRRIAREPATGPFRGDVLPDDGRG